MRGFEATSLGFLNQRWIRRAGTLSHSWIQT